MHSPNSRPARREMLRFVLASADESSTASMGAPRVCARLSTSPSSLTPYDADVQFQDCYRRNHQWNIRYFELTFLLNGRYDSVDDIQDKARIEIIRIALRHHGLHYGRPDQPAR